VAADRAADQESPDIADARRGYGHQQPGGPVRQEAQTDNEYAQKGNEQDSRKAGSQVDPGGLRMNAIRKDMPGDHRQNKKTYSHQKDFGILKIASERGEEGANDDQIERGIIAAFPEHADVFPGGNGEYERDADGVDPAACKDEQEAKENDDCCAGCSFSQHISVLLR